MLFYSNSTVLDANNTWSLNIELKEDSKSKLLMLR